MTVEIVALARDRYAGPGGERLDETAHQPFGEPVADDLNLIDVIFGERRDEAAKEPLLLRGGRQRPHEQECRKGYGEKGANHSIVPCAKRPRQIRATQRHCRH